MKSTLELRKYSSPMIAKIELDNEISLILTSYTPTTEPWGSLQKSPDPSDPFKTNRA